MSNHGGARRGAGRHWEPGEAEPHTPLMWLWRELERRYGNAEIDCLHIEYNTRWQAYQKAKIAEGRRRRGETAE